MIGVAVLGLWPYEVCRLFRMVCSSQNARLLRPFLAALTGVGFDSTGGATAHSHDNTPNLTFSGLLWLLKVLAFAYRTNRSSSQVFISNTLEVTFQYSSSAS